MNIIKQLVTAIVVSTAITAAAQTWPNKPVKIVTSMPVGSAPDSVVRKVADRLKDTWGVPVIVENKPGAAGQIAMEHYLSEKADPHNLYFGDLANFVSMPLLYNKENLVARLQPVIPIYSTYFAVIASGNSDMTNFSDVVRRLPFYGSWAIGSVGHICGAEINDALNLEASHVPYKEYGTWYSDVVNHTLSYSCSSIGSVQSFLRGNRIKLLAIGSPRRLKDFPNLPTIKERFGVDLSIPESWLAVFINTDVDDKILTKINKDIETVVKSKEIQDHIAFLYGNSMDTDLQKFNVRWKKDIEIQKNIIKKYNITIK